MFEVTVSETAAGWTAEVTVLDGGAETRHEVTLSRAELERYGGGDPAELVRRSFEFLLQREPATSILRRFALSDISRYFPEYESSIRA